MKNRVTVLFLLLHATAFAGIKDCSDQYYGEYSCLTEGNQLGHPVRLKINRPEDSLNFLQDLPYSSHSIGLLNDPLEDLNWTYEAKNLTNLDTDSFFYPSITEIPESYPLPKKYQIEFDKTATDYWNRSSSLFIQDQNQANQFCHKDRLLIPSSIDLYSALMEIVLDQNQNLKVIFSDDQRLNLFCQRTREEGQSEFQNDLEMQVDESNLIFSKVSSFNLDMNSHATESKLVVQQTKIKTKITLKRSNDDFETTNNQIESRSKKHRASFDCNVCRSSFTKNDALQIHMRTHTGEKPFQCELCDKKYNQKSNLTTHMKTHTKGDFFQCKLCDKEFTKEGYLTMHMRNHTRDKLFQCELCDKKFTLKGNLERHINTQH